MSHAFLAGLLIAQKRRIRAGQAEIVQGLYYRDTGFFCRPENAGTQQRESIVDVDDVRLEPRHGQAQRRVAARRPYRPQAGSSQLQ
jgi:hypothetical protein